MECCGCCEQERRGKICRSAIRRTNLSSLVSAVAAGRHFGESITGLGGGFAGSGEGGLSESFIDGSFAGAKKGALELVKRSAEKGPRSWQLQTAMVFLIGISVASASPHETKLVETTLEQRFTKKVPPLIIGDKAS